MSAEFGFVAYLSLFGVFIAALAVYASRKPEEASLTFIMAAILFLPQRAGIKFPFVPPLNRDSLPYILILVVFLLRRSKWVRQNRLGRGLDALVLLSMVAAVITSATNSDPLTYGKYPPFAKLPGLTLKDGFSCAGDDLFFMGIPFVVGRLLIRDERLATRFLSTFAVGGLIYTFFIAIELRISPQLHNMVYGYRARYGDFAQMVRSGGYRPSVFLPHALALVMFMLNAVLAAVILLRNKQRILRWSWRWPAVFLFVMMAACKGTASLIYALVAIPLVRYTKPRTQLRVATFLTIVVVTYPALRGADLFPTQKLLAGADAISHDRKESLLFRFQNEDTLLARAREREFFGWGPYDRNEIFEPIYGNQVSITDGEWIIYFGIRGAVGALLRFLMLVVPVWMASRALKKIPGREEKVILAGTATMLAFSTIDLLPNAMFENYPFFMAGALVGMTRVFTARRPENDLPLQQEWVADGGAGDPRSELG